jgi:hypothetical protein
MLNLLVVIKENSSKGQSVTKLESDSRIKDLDILSLKI